jgi:hypothetical protein
MTFWCRGAFMGAIACATICSVSCATVPKEVVELSYRIGQDIQSVHKSYQSLVHRHFDSLRQSRLQYVNDEWAPTFIREWIKDGRLIDVAKGTVVWSEDRDDFVRPTAGREEADLLVTVRQWAQSAMGQIEKKKAELLDPLNVKEAELTSSIDDAFDQLDRGNATVTAHLNSLRKVQEVQDESLAAIHLKDLRDKINDSLVHASDEAAKGLDLVRTADGIVKKGDTLLRKQPNK